MFVIATEGEKTEPSYFAIFGDNLVIHVHCVRGGHRSSPKQVLHRMKQHLERNGITKTDEAWLVVDRDTWSEEDLLQLHKWSQGASNRGFALSNPKFEYWLLLHFEDGTELGTNRALSRRLRRHLPNYDKGVDARKVTEAMIRQAVSRAKGRDSPPCADWPRQSWRTTVYRLVDNILGSQSEQ